MNKADQNHPIWRFLNLLVVAGLIVLFSYTNANNFDETEVKMITQVLLFVGGYEAIKQYIAKNKEKEKT